jgi:hypothetical protein
MLYSITKFVIPMKIGIQPPAVTTPMSVVCFRPFPSHYLQGWIARTSRAMTVVGFLTLNPKHGAKVFTEDC